MKLKWSTVCPSKSGSNIHLNNSSLHQLAINVTHALKMLHIPSSSSRYNSPQICQQGKQKMSLNTREQKFLTGYISARLDTPYANRNTTRIIMYKISSCNCTQRIIMYLINFNAVENQNVQDQFLLLHRSAFITAQRIIMYRINSCNCTKRGSW